MPNTQVSVDEERLGLSNSEMFRIVGEEEKVLKRVQRTLEAKEHRRSPSGIDYDAELIALRDQIMEARLEDIPPLVEEMERLQQVAARRAQVAEGHVDLASPYFGRLVLEEGKGRREVLIGKGTYLDSRTGIRIVDWRDAPVSRIYYRYEEGDDYEENFGGRDVLGEVVVRRSLSIAEGALRRIGSPQGTFVRALEGGWQELGPTSLKLRGGQGLALRPEAHHRPAKLGGVGGGGREDRHLPEITALIDPRQFDLITRPTSGLVVIQGGAGSGKTTIGLHRMAYLNFQDPARFRADRMLIVVFNEALVRYIDRVLPALGVQGVGVTTYERWAQRLRIAQLPTLGHHYHDDTPAVVVRLKKHPAMLPMLEGAVKRLVAHFEHDLLSRRESWRAQGATEAFLAGIAEHWRAPNHAPLPRLMHLRSWVLARVAELPASVRHELERLLDEGRRLFSDPIALWADLFTDRAALEAEVQKLAPGAFRAEEWQEIHAWCGRRIPYLLNWVEERRLRDQDDDAEDGAEAERGVDGQEEAPEEGKLDREDDALLLRLCQEMRGGLKRRKEFLMYEHVFVDEAQDLSPVELAVVLGTLSAQKSVTLAGDVAQRVMLDNGFSDWRGVLSDLGMNSVEVEPLRLSYRSTAEILSFASEVLGDQIQRSAAEATRQGAPVECFAFTHSGEAVAFLSEALRELMQQEPMASVAVIARYPEQAALYYRGLQTGEVPYLRHIADQDFPFRPGVDVTDVRQVKGLEFDYVVLVDVSASVYPDDLESRHLLHIAATRAAHQLWVTTSTKPSTLLPKSLRNTAL